MVSADLNNAEAHTVVRNVAIIQKVAWKTWQAAAWWLERRRGEDWGQRSDLVQQLAKNVWELKNRDGRHGDRAALRYRNGAPCHSLMNAAIEKSTILRALGEQVADKRG